MIVSFMDRHLTYIFSTYFFLINHVFQFIKKKLKKQVFVLQFKKN